MIVLASGSFHFCSDIAALDRNFWSDAGCLFSLEQGILVSVTLKFLEMDIELVSVLVPMILLSINHFIAEKRNKKKGKKEMMHKVS